MEEKIEKVVEKIPSWALCYLINGDTDNLTDEDMDTITEFLERNSVVNVCCPNEDEEAYFTHYPAFGLPCEVYDCEVWYRTE